MDSRDQEQNEERRGRLTADQLNDLQLPASLDHEKVDDLRERKTKVMERINTILQGSKTVSKPQRVIFSLYQPPPKQKREVGETWLDADGKEWVQRDGYAISIPKIDHESLEQEGYLQPRFCPKCNKPLQSGLDKKMWRFNQMCMDCTAAFETQLHIEGRYKEYERQRIMANIRAFYHDVMNGLDDYVGAFDATYVNEFGDVEKWDRVDKPMLRSLVLNDLRILAENFEHDFGEQLENTHDAEYP